jgi:hypothetical protein
MKNLNYILILVLLLTAGCGNNKQNTPVGNASTDSIQQPGTPEDAKEKEEGEEAAGKLMLNNGEKWKANPETTEGIKNLQQLVDGYLKTENSDIKALAGKMESEFTTILQKCTMTGEAHAQLHNFLLPLRDKIAGLKENPSNDAVKDIQAYLDNFKNYFQ